MKKLLLSLTILLSFTSLAQPPAYVPANGLVGWWPFNGNANDESGNGNDGTVNGATLTTDRFGVNNSSFEFDGVDDYIRCLSSGPLSTSSRSISYWSEAVTNNASMIISYGSNNTGGASFLLRQGGGCNHSIDFDINLSLISFKSFIPDPSNWFFITLTYDNSDGQYCTAIKYYVNGILLDSICGTVNPTSNQINTIDEEPVTFGRWCNLSGTQQGGYHFNGKIDDIGIWNRAITQCEIQDLYNASVGSVSTVTQTGATLTADQAGATYQWLDCDNSYAVISGETNQFYIPTNVTGNYAVEVTLNGCVDTSACYHVDYTGIEQLTNTQKELIKIIDFMGRETEFKPNTPLIFIYSDGTRERVMEIQE